MAGPEPETQDSVGCNFAHGINMPKHLFIKTSIVATGASISRPSIWQTPAYHITVATTVKFNENQKFETATHQTKVPCASIVLHACIHMACLIVTQYTC